MVRIKPLQQFLRLAFIDVELSCFLFFYLFIYLFIKLFIFYI